MQIEGVQRNLLALVLGRVQQLLAHIVGQEQQDPVEPVHLDLLPGKQAVLLRQRLENPRGIDRVQPVEQLAQLAQVLPVHERLDQLVLGHFLAIHEIFDQPVPRQQALHLVQVLRQPVEIRV